MKLLMCLVYAALMVSSCLAAIDVEKTVRQVQNILQNNVQLPRLSRDEIIQLLNDIKAEDAKSSASKEQSREITSTTPYSIETENEINSISKQQDSINNIYNDAVLSASAPTKATVESTTRHSQPTVMVVLPYTTRDGDSLQELYTKPPRVEVVPEVKVTQKPRTIQDTLKNNAKIANSKKQDIPEELQAFLDSHGIKSNPSKNNFLLPLDGFKPLPPATVVDGSIQLPENILLTYDLISPNSKEKIPSQMSAQNYLFEPLQPEYPFELDTSSSESKKTVLPLDLPTKTRTTKSTVNPPNYDPIDYDSVKVIPLQSGPSPVEEIKPSLQSDQSKRQTGNNSAEATTTAASVAETTTAPKDSESAAADAGASVADLEDSFGGEAPEQPGDSQLPPPRKNGFYWMLDWNSFLEVGDGDTKVNIRFEPKLGDPQMFLPITVP